MSTAVPNPALTVRLIPIAQICESIHNPRRHFTPAKLAELEASIREVGVLTPLLARMAGDGMFELAAGHRRYRAAKSAGLTEVPVRVVALTDTQLLEVLTIENLQREDVHPLDEARGYEALMRADGAYTPKAIAAKVGKSESYVYRRLKLLNLNPDLRALFERDAITAAHAERLARLDDHLQTEALEDPGVLFLGALQVDDEELDAMNLAPVSRLDEFIRRRTAIDPESPDVQHYFPQLAEAIEEAASEGATLLELSEDYFVRQKLGVGANDPAPLAAPKWHEVTSKKDRCTNTVRGVITHGGPTRVLDVCATKGCPKHFPIAQKIAPKPAASKGAAVTQEPSWQVEQRKREEEQQRWEDLRDKLYPRVLAHVEALSPELTVELIRAAINADDVEETYGVKLTAKNIPLILSLSVIGSSHWNKERFRTAVKFVNFDWRAAEKAIAQEAKAAAKPAAKKTAKKKGKAA
jgi:ParB/RepB/Spo0J family partition protein